MFNAKFKALKWWDLSLGYKQIRDKIRRQFESNYLCLMSSFPQVHFMLSEENLSVKLEQTWNTKETSEHLRWGCVLIFKKATEIKFQKITISELDCLVKFQWFTTVILKLTRLNFYLIMNVILKIHLHFF